MCLGVSVVFLTHLLDRVIETIPADNLAVMFNDFCLRYALVTGTREPDLIFGQSALQPSLLMMCKKKKKTANVKEY